MTRHFEPPSAGAKRRRRVPEEGSDACRVAWSILFVLIVFATVFLLYEHFTVPPGKTSLLVAGVEGVRSTVYTWISPLMEKQEAEPEKKTAPPMTPPTARPPSKQDSPPPPPPTTTTTTTKPAEKTKKEEPKPSKEEPKPNKEEPKPREEDKEGTKKSKKQPKTNKKTTSESSTEKVH